jgi:hypothetical protein
VENGALCNLHADLARRCVLSLGLFHSAAATTLRPPYKGNEPANGTIVLSPQHRQSRAPRGPRADPRLRADARGGDGRIREKLAAGMTKKRRTYLYLILHRGRLVMSERD